jgi:aldehyde dehydrogenase (NAD+)
VPAAVRAFTANAGQVCSAGTRLLVHRSVHDQVIAALVTEVQKIRIGRDLGPLITRDQFARVQSYFDVAREEGAWPATGGCIASEVEGPAGCYVQPTVYRDVDNSMKIAREEIFGPVLGLYRSTPTTKPSRSRTTPTSVWWLACGPAT